MQNPYTEKKLEESVSIRTFSSQLDESELKWHWDEEDREIEALENTDWMFQFDNHLPVEINKKIFIPQGVIHRVIKGTGDLKLKITKWPIQSLSTQALISMGL